MTLMAWFRWSLFGWLGWLLAIGLLASAAGCGDDGGDDDTVDMGAPDAGQLDAFTPEDDAFTPDEDAFVPEEDGGTGDLLDSFESDVATAKCAALFRCCDEESREEFFSQYQCFPGLSCPYEDQQDMIPPADMAACVAVMEALDEVTFGTWLTETRAGRIDFDAASHQSCLDTLATATCGEALTEALYDPRCFARIGGTTVGETYEVERASFDRTAGVGESCVTLFEDPYGSCDPDVAFCCVGDSDNCSTGGEGGEAGTCVAVSSNGESCSQFPDQHCEPGLRCPPAAGIGEPSACEEPAAPMALDEGDTCLSDSFESLGECTDSYCDTETRQCEPTLSNGEMCDFDDQCASGNCEVTSGGGPFVTRECADPSFCIGS